MIEMIDVNIAERVRICMDRYGVKTVNELGRLSGVGRPTLQDIVTHRNKFPRIDTVYRIANGFGLTLQQFLFEDESECEDRELKVKEINDGLTRLTSKQLDLVLFLIKGLK